MVVTDEMAAHIVNTALDFVEDGLRLHERYSGRGMYGEQCVAFYGGDTRAFLVSLAIDAPEDTREDFRDMLKNERSDNLGLDMVYYFPGFKVSKELLKGFARIYNETGLEEAEEDLRSCAPEL